MFSYSSNRNIYFVRAFHNESPRKTDHTSSVSSKMFRGKLLAKTGIRVSFLANKCFSTSSRWSSCDACTVLLVFTFSLLLLEVFQNVVELLFGSCLRFLVSTSSSSSPDSQLSSTGSYLSSLSSRYDRSLVIFSSFFWFCRRFSWKNSFSYN